MRFGLETGDALARKFETALALLKTPYKSWLLPEDAKFLSKRQTLIPEPGFDERWGK